MDSLVQRFLQLFMEISTRLEQVFGLSSFSFRSRNIKVVSVLIQIVWLVVYLYTYEELLDFAAINYSNVTLYARNILFGFSWLLLFFIFVNETINGFGSKVEGKRNYAHGDCIEGFHGIFWVSQRQSQDIQQHD